VTDAIWRWFSCQLSYVINDPSIYRMGPKQSRGEGVVTLRNGVDCIAASDVSQQHVTHQVFILYVCQMLEQLAQLLL